MGKAKGTKGTRTKGASDIQPEVSYETMSDELFKMLSGALGVNLKRLVENALTHDKDVDNVALGMLNDARAQSNRLLNNAISDDNLANKLAIVKAFRADDIATDRQWNVDEQGYTAEKILSAMQDPAVAMAMAVAIAEAMNKGKDST